MLQYRYSTGRKYNVLMDIHSLSRILGRLSIEQKAELVAFVRSQTTDDLKLALTEITQKLEQMGIAMPAGQSTQEAAATLEAISKLL